MLRQYCTRAFAAALCVAACSQPGLAQAPPPTLLDIQAENTVSYFHDVWDYSKIAGEPGMAAALRPIKPFQSATDISDIVVVNGRPAKGTWITRLDPQLGLDPNAIHGAAMPRAIADVTRAAMVHDYIEILQPDSTPIGTLMLSGMNMGSPPPGAPLAATLGNRAVTGGTGAFLGARGQAGNAVSTFRVASISEDPANRRVNGGGPKRLIIHLIPMSRPEIVTASGGPAIFHADLSPVTAMQPAKASEVLIVKVTGLGPTHPGIDPGQPFPLDALQEVNSPVDVTVNGQSTEVINKIGWPGLFDTYRVDFRVPGGTLAGNAAVQLTVAWIAGPAVNIPSR